MKKRLKQLFLLLLMLISLFAYVAYTPAVVKDGGLTITRVTNEFTNAFLISDDKSNVVFDAGLDRHANKLIASLKAHGVTNNNLKAIIVSHAHNDHAGGAAALKAAFSAPIIAGFADVAQLQSGTHNRLCANGYVAESQLESNQAATFPVFTPDIAVSNTYDLKPLTGWNASLHIVAGHTAGSLIMVANQSVFVGDLFRGEMVRRDKAAVHMYMCDLHDNREDIQDVLNRITPQATMFFTGHFGAVPRASVENLVTQGFEVN